MEKQLIEEISGVATLRFNRPDRLDALFRPQYVREMFSLKNSNGTRVSVHWFAGVLQSLCSSS
jgi:hypothetical protein